MPVIPTVFPDSNAVGAAAAQYVAGEIALSGFQGRRFLLGCPSGRTPTPTYQALTQIVAQRGVDLAHVVIVMMDEYLITGDDGALTGVSPTAPYSCVGFARRNILAPLGAAARAAGVRPPAALWTPHPEDPGAYDEQIRKAGGIDVFLLASGASDGHIAFNQPGTPRASRTHITRLGDATRLDNMSTFPDFGSLAEVPTYGVSVGISTIVDLSRRVVMMTTGADKSRAFQLLASATSYDPAWPATAYTECAHALFYADLAAASGEVADFEDLRDNQDIQDGRPHAAHKVRERTGT